MTSMQLLNYCVDVIGPQYCDVRSDYEVYPPDYYIKVPCGTCFSCLKRKRLEWSFRLLQEIRQHKESTFVTLTFSNEYLEEFKDNPKRPLMLYIDRLRKALGYRPRYWFISELGDDDKYTGRLHFHGIFFGTSRKTLNFHLQRNKWKYGNVWLGYVNFKTANYVTKYMLKFQKDYKPIMLLSNGIGLSYISKRSLDYHLNNFDPRMYCVFLGQKYPLSNYYKTKLFDEHIKLCFMINRYFDNSPKEYYLNGFKFTDARLYENYRKSYYNDSLRCGTSLPIKPRKSLIGDIEVNSDFNNFIKKFDLFNYGKELCISESRITKGWSL